MVLFGVIMLGTHQLVANSIRYYIESTTSLDIQREGLIGLSRLTSELETSNRESMHAGTVPVGFLVFPSIFDVDRDFITDEDGRPKWQGVGCYFQGNLPNGKPALWFKGEDFLTDMDTPPDPYSFSPAYDLSYFQSNGAGRVIARNVVEFEPVLNTDTVSIKLVVQLTTRETSTMTFESKALPRN